MLIAEKNRFQSPRADLIKSSCVKIIEVLEEQIASITKEIDDLIAKDKLLQAKKETLQTISGIGTVVSNDLIALLPELGTRSLAIEPQTNSIITRCCTKYLMIAVTSARYKT